MPDYEQHVFYVFPGQGSQYAGMGSDIHDEFDVARKVYAQAGGVLGYDIAELSFKDPEDKLNLTRFTQPALLTHSVPRAIVSANTPRSSPQRCSASKMR